MGWLFLLGAIVSEVAATLSLRAARDSAWFYLVVGGGYVAAFTFLALVLREGVPLGVAYGIWAAAGVTAVAVLSHYVFGEPLSLTMLAGIVLIAAGVLLVETGH